MSFFEFPHTRTYDRDLGWLIKTVIENDEILKNFVALNIIKYADPIQWSITTQYEKNTIVIDPMTGTAYISVAPVPSGVSLTNTDYWTVVFDLGQFVTKANNNFTLRLEDEGTTTATFPTNSGQWLVWGGNLYEALINIIAGDQYVVNSNIKRITMESIIGNLPDLTTTIKTNIVEAINSEVADRKAADLVLDNSIVIERDARVLADQTLDNSIVIERNARIAADNTREINQSNRKYLLIFDSYGAVGSPTLAQIVATACPGGYHYIVAGGSGFIGNSGGQTWGDALTAYCTSASADELASFTDVIIFGGINDYAFTPTNIIAAMTTFNGILQTYLPQCLVTLCPISWSIRADSSLTDYAYNTLTGYSQGASALGWKYENGLNAYIHSDDLMVANDVHPTAAAIPDLGNAIVNFIKTGVIPKLTSESKVATITPQGNFTTSSTYIATDIHDGMVHLFGAVIISGTSPSTVQSGYTHALALEKISNCHFRGVIENNLPYNQVTVPAYIHNTITAAWELKPITLQFYSGYVFICVEGGDLTFDALQTATFDIICPIDKA